MITYVDTSTLLKVVVEEDGSDRAGAIWDAADDLAAASLIVVEARAALAAAHRAQRLTPAAFTRSKREVASLVAELNLVEVTSDLIDTAAEIAEAERLRGYDAVHLASALFVDATVLTSADDELCAAAGRRGLHVANPLHPHPAETTE